MQMTLEKIHGTQILKTLCSICEGNLARGREISWRRLFVFVLYLYALFIEF